MGKLKKESVMQRQENERSTSHPLLLDIGTHDASRLEFGGIAIGGNGVGGRPTS
jgi:hypothetical protein